LSSPLGRGKGEGETGAIRKDPGGKLNIGLVYPNTYWVGMSNLGLQTMYRLFNAHPGILCERFFTDYPRSVESSRPLQDFHIIAFSVSYELDYPQVIRFLLDNNIRVNADERQGHPIVMAGGSALITNPEPIADALDICFLGDGESLPERLEEAYTGSGQYHDFLDRLSRIRGIYIPAFARPVLEDDAITGFEGPRPALSVIEPLHDPARTAVATRDTAFGDMYLVEIARGCPFSCKFCSAREIYSPYRPVPIDRLVPVLDDAARHRDKVGLVSTSLNNHPDAAEIFGEIRKRDLKVAPPSLRPGMIGADLLKALEESGVKGVTLAPETGSEVLRYALGKRISNNTIFEDVYSLVSSGIRDIKLYFMVGVPGEDRTDLDAITDLIKRIRQSFIQVSRGNRRIGKISASINTMVPKPHTPFERQAMAEPVDAKARIARIVKALKAESNVTVSYEGPKWSYIQALLCRGDRRLLGLIVEMAKTDPGSWQRLLKNWPRNPDYYALRERPEDEILPWSFYSTECSPETCHGR
jgi:radical SAM superfamily enzyme YgiQ (UPF0313 family)